jgi:hypothetical protein
MAENNRQQKSSCLEKCQCSNNLAVVVILCVVVIVTILYIVVLIVLIGNGSSGFHTISPNASASNQTSHGNDREMALIMVNSKQHIQVKLTCYLIKIIKPYLNITPVGCGGTLSIPNDARGIIAYKNGTGYENDERCVWLIKSAMRKVRIKFVEHDFNQSDTRGMRYDGFVVGGLDDHHLEEFTCQKL